MPDYIVLEIIWAGMSTLKKKWDSYSERKSYF